MIVAPKKTVYLEDLVPPFVDGDWITGHTRLGLEHIWKNSGHVPVPEPRVVRLAGVAEFVGKSSQTGWLLFGIDSSHFRKATSMDVVRERRRLLSLSQNIKNYRKVLDDALDNLSTLEE